MRSKYKYILLSNDSGTRLELQNAPQGWDAQKFTFIRDLVYLGVLKNITVEFDFVGDGFNFLQYNRLLFGMDADIMIRVYKNNPNEFLFEGKLNFENYREQRKFNRFRVDVIQSSLVQNFQNREDVELNVFNSISLDRKPVVPAMLVPATFRGRSIQFISEFEGVSNTEPEIYHHTIPFLIKTNGNPNVLINFYNFYTGDEGDDPSDPGWSVENPLINSDNALYKNETPNSQTVPFSWSFDFNLNYLGNTTWDGPVTLRSKIRFVLVNADNSVADELYTADYDQSGNALGSVTYNSAGSLNVEVGAGQSIVLLHERWFLFSSSEQPLNNFNFGTVAEQGVASMHTEITYSNITLSINEPSVIENSEHPVLLPHELFTNLIKQINGGTFESNFFGREELGYYEDGPGAYLAITTGELLRGIDPTTVQISTSFRKAFKSYHSVFCLGAIITPTGIKVEPLDDLFNNEIVANLGEVDDLEIGPAKEFIFNRVKAGYPINEYEEQNGRDEFNTTYQYTNSFKSINKELDLLSDYCGDGYGIEFARRQGIISTGTKDTKYDSKIFFIDLIKVGDELITKRLEEVLLVEGIFSPETAMNLNIAVGQNILRHRKFLNIPLHKKPKEYYFQTKDKNTGLKLITALGTTNDGENIQTGNDYYFLNDERNFKCPLTVANMYNVIRNPFGLVRYTYEGEQFFDFIMEAGVEIDKGGATTWRALGTRDTPVRVEEELVGNLLKYGSGAEDFVKYASGEKDIIEYAN